MGFFSFFFSCSQTGQAEGYFNLLKKKFFIEYARAPGTPHTYYYTKKDLIKFSTPLTSSQSTSDTAFTGINKYILYRDASL